MIPRSLMLQRLAVILSALAVSLVAIGYLIPVTALAQSLPCGNIIAPEVIWDPAGDYDERATVAVADCEDPFSVTTDPASPYILEIDGVEVANGEVYIQNEPIQIINVLGSGIYNYTETFLFRHQGNDYVFVDQFSPEPTLQQYSDFASTYFPTAAEAQRYLEILVVELETGDTSAYYFDDLGQPILDVDTGETVFNRYNTFRSEADNYLYSRPILYATGTYTMLIKNSELILTAKSIWQYVKDIFINTAYAQSVMEPHFYTITFSIADPLPEPEGASSVLFLPGIQASRLYTEGSAGTENQLWEPNRDTDVSRLRMNISGASINDIYTKDVIDEVALPLIGGNIYKGFLGMLEDLVEEEVIQNFEAFAYDWRYGVDDVVLTGTQYENEVRSVIAAVEQLAGDSYTGRVTLVGHSNGGLVAKRLITELERQGKSDLVDKVIFVGTPHLGTPKAIATVLHGYDQQKLGGAVIDDSTARAVIQNMPGAYGLLPSQRYLDITTAPVISVSAGVSTTPMYQLVGSEVDSVFEYRNIMNGLDGREDDFADISNPYRTNPYMLQDALDLHAELDYWEAPNSIEVFNLVGVGLPTLSKIEYRNVTERINCIPTVLGGAICDTVNILRPFAHFTQYGDETVTSLSAETVTGETYYFDFLAYDEGAVFSGDFSHADITELESVHSFVKNIINPTLAEIEYITESRPEYVQEYEVTAIDSPVRIIKEDSSGNRTGVVLVNGTTQIVKEIPGSDYMEFAGTKYVIVPKNEDTTTYLYGEGYGSYTLTTATFTGGQQTVGSQVVNATTTPTMLARYDFIEGVYSNIVTDYDGDGTSDHEMTMEGEVISAPEITFDALKNQITSLNLSKSRTNPLLVLARLAEEADKLKVSPKIADRISDGLLMQLRDTIKLYTKKRWITEGQRDGLIELINGLINL